MASLLVKLILPLLLFVAVVLAEDPYYTIFPKDIADNDVNDRITEDLYGKIDESKIYRSGSRHLGTIYWYAPLNDADRDYYSRLEGVRTVSRTGEYGVSPLWATPTTKRRRRLTRRAATSQVPAPAHLKMVTQSKGKKLSDLDGYYYDDTAGRGIRVYVIDTGLDSAHKEFDSTDVAWRFAGPFGSTEKSDSDEEKSHGTCMASMALGARDGVSKKAELTMVKVDQAEHQGKSVGAERYMDALVKVYDAVKDGDEKGKAVVSMSWGVDPPANEDYNSALQDTFTFLLSKIIKDLDVPGLVSAGNNAHTDPEPNSIPAILGKERLPELVVVGAVDLDGDAPEYFQKANWMKLFSPGDDVECAEQGGKYLTDYGTSQANAVAAGLTAYFMARDGLSGADARAKLYDAAYPRKNGGVNVVWNEIKVAEFTAPVPMEPEGTCRFDLTQTRNSEGRYGMSIKIFDSDGTEIANIGSDTRELKSKLDGRLVVTMDPSNGDTKFEYGPQQKWTMDKSDGVPSCKVHDWKSGASSTSMTRKMECKFICE